MLKKIYSSIKKTLPVSLKKKLLNIKPNITQDWFPANSDIEKGRVLLITVGDGFNQEIMRASTLLVLGYAHGWAETCGSVKLVWEKNIVKELSCHDNPVVYTNIYNYINWDKQQIKTLKNFDTFAFVNVHPRKYKEFVQKNPLINHDDPFFYGGYNKAYDKLINSEPSLVCSLGGSAAWKWYEGWIEDGLRFEFIKMAADPYYYYPDPIVEKYKDIKMTYVGGYWPDKAQAFDVYLRPFEEILHTYGYGKWPYKHYGGKLDIKEERQLYSSAGLVPLITHPSGWDMAEVTERYFKAPACKAFCIADQNPGLTEVFSKDEMIQAENPEHFKFLVNNYLQGKIDVEHWKKKGYEAVMSRHLYKHRAMQIRKILEN